MQASLRLTPPPTCTSSLSAGDALARALSAAREICSSVPSATSCLSVQSNSRVALARNAALSLGAVACAGVEKVAETAEKVSEWLEAEVKIWKDLEKVAMDEEWLKQDVVGRQRMDARWLEGVKKWKGQKKAVPLSRL